MRKVFALLLLSSFLLSQPLAFSEDIKQVTEPITEPVTATATESSAPVQNEASVQQATMTHIQPTPSDAAPLTADAVSIELLEVPLRDYSTKEYKAVQFTVKNMTPGQLELLMGEVQGAVEEQILAMEKTQAKARKRNILGRSIGMATAVPGFMGIGGLAGVVAASAVRTAYHAGNAVASVASAANQNENSSQGQYITRFQNILVNPTQVYTFSAVVPKTHEPHLKMVVRDLQRNQVVDILK